MKLRERLDKLRTLEQKATPGPWEVGMRNGANGRTIFARDGEQKASSDKQDVAHWDSGICDVHGLYLNMRVDEQPTGEAKSNAALIAAMRNAIGPLLEVVEAQHRALEGMVLRYTTLVNSGDCGNWDVENESDVITARAAISLMDKEVK